MAGATWQRPLKGPVHLGVVDGGPLAPRLGLVGLSNNPPEDPDDEEPRGGEFAAPPEPELERSLSLSVPVS